MIKFADTGEEIPHYEVMDKVKKAEIAAKTLGRVIEIVEPENDDDQKSTTQNFT